MKTKCVRAFGALALSACLVGAAANAGEIETKADGHTIWQAGIDGVEMEFAPDGSFERIYSRVSHPVAFPDRQGIAKSQIIAEEKAKAAIVKYLDQHVASSTIVAEVQNDINKSTMSRGTGQTDAINKTSERNLVENLTQITTSAAAGKLRGVITLERGYDDKLELAWVKVGISKKTIAASEALKEGLAGRPSANPSQSDGPRKSSGVVLPGSEVQQSGQKDW